MTFNKINLFGNRGIQQNNDKSTLETKSQKSTTPTTADITNAMRQLGQKTREQDPGQGLRELETFINYNDGALKAKNTPQASEPDTEGGEAPNAAKENVDDNAKELKINFPKQPTRIQSYSPETITTASINEEGGDTVRIETEPKPEAAPKENVDDNAKELKINFTKPPIRIESEPKTEAAPKENGDDNAKELKINFPKQPTRIQSYSPETITTASINEEGGETVIIE